VQKQKKERKKIKKKKEKKSKKEGVLAAIFLVLLGYFYV
jgi:hypothetical protein